jgi:recombination protein RecT
MSAKQQDGGKEKLPVTVQTLRQQLEQRLDQFKHALPSHITPEQFVAVLTRAAMANNDLVLADRISFFEAALAAAIDGLMPDGKEGAMVIYNTKIKVGGKEEWIKKVQWLPMIRGILTKLYNTGQVKSATVGIVYQGDEFRSWTDDDGEHLFHEEADDADRDMSVIRRYYAAVYMKDGGRFVETMRVKDIEKIRNSSKSKDRGPWVDWFEEMAKKSVFKRLAKRLPVSREIAQVISRDDFLYDGPGMRDVTPATDRPKGLTNRLDALADNRGIGAAPDFSSEEDKVPAENAGKPADDKAGQQSAGDKSDDAAAFRAGRDAKQKGMSRKTMPADYRGGPLGDAWLEGFDAEGGDS